jgi:type II secretion system protein L
MTEAGLSVDACHAEWQLLPGEGKRLWLEQGRAILVDPQRALCLPEAALEELAGWLAAQGWELQTLPRWRVGRCLEPAEQVVEAPLATLATGLGRRPFNLLQGAFAPRRRSLRQQRLWRLAAALLLAAASLATALPAIERRQLEAHVVQRQQAMAQLLRQTLPAVTRVVDPVAQMRSALRQSAGAGDGLQLLGRIAPLLAGGSRITLDALEYRNQVLDLTLIASDVATLDALRERVVSQGLQAELTAANPGSQGVEGRLRVAGGGS